MSELRGFAKNPEKLPKNQRNLIKSWNIISKNGEKSDGITKNPQELAINSIESNEILKYYPQKMATYPTDCI